MMPQCTHESTAPYILGLSTRQSWLVTFTTQVPCPWGRSLRYSLNRRMGGSNSLIQIFWRKEKKIPCSHKESNNSSVIHPVSYFSYRLHQLSSFLVVKKVLIALETSPFYHTLHIFNFKMVLFSKII